jgi:hypothetical protein
MRRVCNLIAGVVTAVTLAGCSETAPETGTVQFKGTSSPAIDALRDSMAKNAAGGKSTSKSAAAPAKPGTDTKAADTKAATDTKEADPKAAPATKADEKP